MSGWKMTQPIGACAAFILSAVVVFYLYGLPAEPCIYLCLLACLVLVKQCADRLRKGRKRQEQLETLKKEAVVYLDPAHFPKAESGEEQGYQELAQILDARCKKTEKEKREKLEAADRYYTRWSHQIKTPIAGMRLLLEEEELDRRAMERELLHIEQYVETALQYQRLGGSSRDLVIRRCRLDGLVKQAVKRVRVLFLQKRVSVELGCLETEILTDEKWFVFVLEQLITNAVKYTKSGGKVTVYLKKEKSILVVEDTGIGISPEDLPRIFEWGYTGYNGRMEKHSTGIGLALCKQTMDMLGHSIWVESELARGTRVCLGIGNRILSVM